MKRIIVLALVLALMLTHLTYLALAQPPYLYNGTFERGLDGWSVFFSDEKVQDGEGGLDYNRSYFAPVFKMADDEQRFISGSTLQIDAVEYTRWRAGIYQVIDVPPGLTISFTVTANAFSIGRDGNPGGIYVSVGIAPDGGGCAGVVAWNQVYVGHLQMAKLVAPGGKSEDGRMTICIMGEPQYALWKNALFLDDVVLFSYGTPAMTPTAGSPVIPTIAPTPPDPALTGLAQPSSPALLSGLAGQGAPAETGGVDGSRLAWGVLMLLIGLVVVIGTYCTSHRVGLGSLLKLGRPTDSPESGGNHE